MRKIVFLLIICYLAVGCKPAEEASTLGNVEKTKTIRCGYVLFEPYIIKNPNTGELSGVTVDYLNRVAKDRGFKVDWNMEVSFDQVIPTLNLNKIDMFCVPCSPIEDFKKVADFVGSFGQLPYYIYVPQNSQTTAEQLKMATFAATDGFIPSVLTPEVFPDAKLISLPSTSSAAEIYDQLKYKKVDALINEDVSASNYIRSNPDVMRRFSDEPVAIKTMSFIIKKGDSPWAEFVQQMTDTQNPNNKKIFEELKTKYRLNQDALLP